MRLTTSHAFRPALLALCAALCALAAGSASASPVAARFAGSWPQGKAVVGFRSEAALARALQRFPARIARRLPHLHAVELEPTGSLPRFAQALSGQPGIAYVERIAPRHLLVEPALSADAQTAGAYEWQFGATHEDQVPAGVSGGAGAITIAVIDTGGDVAAPDLAAKTPRSWSILSGTTDVTDANGHGTFVSSLAAGSPTNGEGIAGFGGNAKLLLVQAAGADGTSNSVDEANAIVYAVDHGANIINMSFGGPGYTTAEQTAVNYAAAHNVLLVAAAGNSALNGNDVMYPAALLQPVGSNGQGGIGLSVGATTSSGLHASFSETGSFISLAAPGENVLGALSNASSTTTWPRTSIPGSAAGAYGFASGTSFSSPEVAGAAALVWAANPALSAVQVAQLLKDGASGNGSWNDQTGYGIINVASSVARAETTPTSPLKVTIGGTRTGTRLHLTWNAPGAVSYSVSVSQDGRPIQVLLGATSVTANDFDLFLDHRYSFTVSAAGANGLRATSAAFVVDLTRAASALTLKASRTSGRGRLRVVLTAQLRALVQGLTPGSRPLVFEAYSGSAWRPFARANTTGSGKAVRAFVMRRGSYWIRARFGGAADLHAAVSRAVTIRVR